jgi:alpha-L-rhamnosidase
MSGTRILGPIMFEHTENALGRGTPAPRMSWRIASEAPQFSVTAYELELTVPDAGTSTVIVESADHVLVPWPFEPLTSRARASVRVRVTDGTTWTAWSEASSLEIGLLAPADWSARFISPRTLGGLDQSAPVLTRVVSLRTAVRSARFYATAHGLYIAAINGTTIGDEIFAPGWTSYSHRLRYQTYDVTEVLHAGDNTIEVLLGNGWYRGRLGFGGGRAFYGDRLALLAQLEVTYVDGTTERFVTDESWAAYESQILADDLYDGQRTDRRRPSIGTCRDEVVALEENLERLVAPVGPPVRRTGLVPAIKIDSPTPARTLVDFGQNLVGWVRLRLRNTTRGNEVVVRHAEVLEDGELCVRPLRTAKATDSYILAGEALEVLEPSLSFHGFRYAEISGADGLDIAAVEAVVVGSDLTRTGWFESSDQDLNKLHENVVWSMRSNFLDVPTDCPQRDERLGWTADIQVFSPTASFLFDCAGFLTSWLSDLAAEQQPDGSVPMVVPDVLGLAVLPAAWGDAAVIVPSVVHERFGDKGVLEQQFQSMRSWVDKVSSLTHASGVWSGGFQLGDWLDPSAAPTKPWAARADADVVATAYLARSADLVARAAAELGYDDDARTYAAFATETRRAFAREYVTPTGRVLSDCPTVYAISIMWDLLPDHSQREAAGRRLADLVRASAFRVSTGFVGTPLILDALCRAGEHDVAYRLLLEKDCPSWLYPVTMGATTVWERWDSMLPDGSINPGEMTSFNHYALGAVADWMHRSVAGLAPLAPGYRHVLVRPIPGGGLTWAAATHLSPYGEVSVRWQRENGQFRLEVRMPVGTTATVHIPGRDVPEVVGHGRHTWETADDLTRAVQSDRVPTIRGLIDNKALFDRVVDVLVDRGVASDKAEVASLLLPHFNDPASPFPLMPAVLLAGALDAIDEITSLLEST